MLHRKKIRYILYSALVTLAVLTILEFGARYLEKQTPPLPVDARSNLDYQLPCEMPASLPLNDENADIQFLQCINWIWSPIEREKPEDELRVVILGGSAAAGWGVSKTTSYAGRLQRLLSENNSGKTVHVFNLANIGHASAQQAWLLEKEAPIIQPDLIVTIMGNNEYLDLDARFHDKSRLPVDNFAAARWTERTFALARLFRPAIKEPPDLQDLGQPLPKFKKTPKVRKLAHDRLGRSLKQIKQIADQYHAGLLVCTVPVNRRYFSVREWNFFTIQHDEYPDIFNEIRWGYYYNDPDWIIKQINSDQGKTLGERKQNLLLGIAYKMKGNRKKMESYLGRTVRMPTEDQDDLQTYKNMLMYLWAMQLLNGPNKTAGLINQFIANHFRSELVAFQSWREATLAFYGGEYAMARQKYDFALNHDDLPLRADDAINHHLMMHGKDVGAKVFDLCRAMDAHALNGIPGFDLFLDYCHYNARGNIILAYLLSRPVAESLKITLPAQSLEQSLDQHNKAHEKRRTDHPTLEHYVGVDYSVTMLVDETFDYNASRRQIIQEHIDQDKQKDLAYVFLGNEILNRPNNPEEAIGINTMEFYKKALEINPEMSSAKKNIQFLKDEYKSYWKTRH